MGHFPPFYIGCTIPRRLLSRQQARVSIPRRQKFTTTKHNASGIPKETTERKGKTSVTLKPEIIATLPLLQRLGPLSKAFGIYDRAQRRRPYLTVFCSSVVIYLCGDLAAQNIGAEGYELSRTVRNITIGGICAVPSYKWYVYKRLRLRLRFNDRSKLRLGSSTLVRALITSRR